MVSRKDAKVFLVPKLSFEMLLPRIFHTLLKKADRSFTPAKRMYGERTRLACSFWRPAKNF